MLSTAKRNAVVITKIANYYFANAYYQSYGKLIMCNMKIIMIKSDIIYIH